MFGLQRPDGGWAMASLGNWKRADGGPLDDRVSDGYGTGLAVYVLRLAAGIAADDLRLHKGLLWLKTHQRTSGCWFTRSPHKNDEMSTYLGTAYASPGPGCLWGDRQATTTDRGEIARNCIVSARETSPAIPAKSLGLRCQLIRRIRFTTGGRGSQRDCPSTGGTRLRTSGYSKSRRDVGGSASPSLPHGCWATWWNWVSPSLPTSPWRWGSPSAWWRALRRSPNYTAWRRGYSRAGIRP